MNNLDVLRSKYESRYFYGLEVFETGDVYKDGEKMTIIRDRGVYERVNLRINGKATSRSISRLVYTLFIEPEFNSRDNRYYIDTNGRCAGEYVLSEIKKIRSFGTHKRIYANNENWGIER